MKKSINFLLGTVLGGFVGGGIILLLAPGSGDETRIAVKERLSSLRTELRKSIDEKRAVLEAELQDYKTR